MTGLARQVTFSCVCGLLSASVARAGPPDPANSDCTNVGSSLLVPFPCTKAILNVVGNTGGVVDPVGEFCVTFRDFNNQPIPNAPVVIDFSNCDLQLCADQLDPGVIVDCISQNVRKLTDASGVACFRAQGHSRSPASLGCGGAAKDCVQVYADGGFLCSGDAPTFDLVGGGVESGLNPNDLSEFIQQWLVCGTNNWRCNYECSNQVLDPNDLSAFVEVWLGRGGSTASCAGPKCP